MSIMNLTQHLATKEQIEAGVFDLPEQARKILTERLTFDSLPSATDILERAEDIAALAASLAAAEDRAEDGPVAVSDAGAFALYAMIGGAPYLMAALERELRDQSITPLYAFSMRESVEFVEADGSVRKENVFRHKGFIG